MDSEIERRIESAYQRSGNSLGWRFLYSPPATLESARVAFVGLNPGGRLMDGVYETFAMKEGSAYRDESWAGQPPGCNRLQMQVLALFKLVKERPENVLAGNLVPFRSPDWRHLKDRKAAVRFGEDLWRSVLRRARPKLVVAMGRTATDILAGILQVENLRKHPVGWGRVAARRGQFADGTFIGLPHLSRHGIMTRPKSKPFVEDLFSGI